MRSALEVILQVFVSSAFKLGCTHQATIGLDEAGISSVVSLKNLVPVGGVCLSVVRHHLFQGNVDALHGECKVGPGPLAFIISPVMRVRALELNVIIDNNPLF